MLNLLYLRKNKIVKSTYDNLYIDILKIGRTRVGKGLSYNHLKSKLECIGYDFDNDCIELAVKQWFYDCFHHRDGDHLPLNSVEEIDDHLDCNFILKGASCLILVEYEISKNSKTIAGWSIFLSVVAVFVSLFQVFHSNYDDLDKKQLKTQEELLKTLKKVEIKNYTPRDTVNGSLKSEK